ncbi:MAG TPA: CdaR family protein [Tepidisphaeraceae bacterium]|jgi:hypothetical protein|nr:CdaR family protein [Tepidisphaeraceae bacterium]
MADIESKTGQTLGIPTATPKAEKRPTFSAAGKPTHVEQHGRAGALKTFLWVAPLTALIWIYAEREQISSAPDVRVQIKLVSKSSDRIITVVKPTERMVSLDIQGPRASVNELREVLAKAPLEIYITPEVGYKGDISLAEPITKSDLFKTYAVTVSAARPPVEIKVEAKAARRIPVKRLPKDTFVTSVTFEPESVVVEGPKDTLEAIKPENLVAYADLSDFASKPPGSYVQDVTISLGSPTYVEGVTMKESVRAKVEISKTAPYTIAIPIVLQINGRVVSDDKFKISTTQDTLGGVEVVGPLDKIELLKQRNFPAAVIVDMTDARNFDFATITTSAEKPYTLKPENYRMPPGVTVNNPTRDITIAITRRGN